MFQALATDERVVVVEAGSPDEGAALGEAIGKDGGFMAPEFLPAVDADEVAEEMTDDGLGDGVRAVEFGGEGVGVDGAGESGGAGWIDEGFAAGIGAEFGGFELVEELFGDVEVGGVDDDGELAGESDLDGGAPAFVEDLAEFAEMTGGFVGA